jgi:micrococcal nuclease
MKFFKTLIIAALLTFSVQFTFSQTKLDGKVVEIVDGKTVIIETAVTKNRFTAQLEYIEIPEPEQQLSQTVKEHLQKLLLGKDVEFIARILHSTKTVGKLYLGEVDVSQQLLRDGAAWYAVQEKSRQDSTESETYQIVEAQAKLEKRGVWGIQNLLPAWEYRAEKIREKARKEMEASQQINNNPQNSPRNTAQKKQKTVTTTNTNVTMWADVSGNEEKKYLNIEGLFSGYNSEKSITYLYTGGSFLDLGKTEAQQKIEFRTLYAYQGSTTIERDIYVIGFLSEAENYKYEKANTLTITGDKKQIYSSKAVRFYRPGANGVQELLLYKIQRSSLQKILKAADVKVKIGATSGSMPELSQVLIEKLLNVTN